MTTSNPSTVGISMVELVEGTDGSAATLRAPTRKGTMRLTIVVNYFKESNVAKATNSNKTKD
jgi:hypothetical protein